MDTGSRASTGDDPSPHGRSRAVLTQATAEDGRYLYAITRGISAADVSAVSGLGGAPISLIEHRDLTAIVSNVDLTEWDEASLRPHADDPRRLDEVAYTHHAVVSRVASVAPTAPMRLATVCCGEDGVRSRLDEWHSSLHRILSRIEGRMEWNVTALSPNATSIGSPVGTRPRTVRLSHREVVASSGAADMRAAVALADRLHLALSRCAVASRRLLPRSRNSNGHRSAPALNGAYLVDNDGAAEFHELTRRLAEKYPDVRLDLRGPWPPYSFATLEST